MTAEISITSIPVTEREGINVPDGSPNLMDSGSVCRTTAQLGWRTVDERSHYNDANLKGLEKLANHGPLSQTIKSSIPFL